jgi:hypothetical protein
MYEMQAMSRLKVISVIARLLELIRASARSLSVLLFPIFASELGSTTVHMIYQHLPLRKVDHTLHHPSTASFHVPPPNTALSMHLMLHQISDPASETTTVLLYYPRKSFLLLTVATGHLLLVLLLTDGLHPLTNPR